MMTLEKLKFYTALVIVALYLVLLMWIKSRYEFSLYELRDDIVYHHVSRVVWALSALILPGLVVGSMLYDARPRGLTPRDRGLTMIGSAALVGILPVYAVVGWGIWEFGWGSVLQPNLMFELLVEAVRDLPLIYRSLATIMMAWVFSAGFAVAMIVGVILIVLLTLAIFSFVAAPPTIVIYVLFRYMGRPIKTT